MTLTRESTYKEIYNEAIKNGCSPTFADMLAARSAPALHGGDTHYFAGRGTLAKQFENNEEQLNYIVSTAKKAGYNPGVNDVYEPGMAEFIGDPRAFVSPAGGINQIKHVAEERNLTVDGPFKRSRVVKDEPFKPVIHKKILKRLSREMIAADPSLGRKSKREVKEAVMDKHAYKGSGNE